MLFARKRMEYTDRVVTVYWLAYYLVAQHYNGVCCQYGFPGRLSMISMLHEGPYCQCFVACDMYCDLGHSKTGRIRFIGTVYYYLKRNFGQFEQHFPAGGL